MENSKPNLHENRYDKRKRILIKIKDLEIKVAKMQSLLMDLKQSVLNTDLKKK
jgi:hypothetical protein